MKTNEIGQVSVEYLFTIAFGMLLALIAAVIAFQVVQIASVVEAKIQQVRQETIASFMA